ncbi:MAG: hypothetical protein AAFR22_23275, partial [Chloroflexota bacterium]
MTEQPIRFDNLTLHLTYYRFEAHLQVVVVNRTLTETYMVCCQEDRGVVWHHRFADVMAAKRYLLERSGVPLEAWLDTDYPYDDMLGTPDVEVA